MLETMPAADLYEPAVQPQREPARLHLGEHSLYLGPLGTVAPHVHATAVLVVGLYDGLRFRPATDAGPACWQRAAAVVVPAGVAHELHTGDAPVAVFYPAHARTDGHTLAALLRPSRQEASACVFGVCDNLAGFRALYESRTATAADAGEQLDDLLSSRRAVGHRRLVDPRVLAVMAQLHQVPQQTDALTAVAAAHGLSPSRLMHLFAEHLNTPFRRYRTWCRLQAALREASSGVSLTQAALAAGFSDSQHFSREFRRAFGVTASEVMRRVRTP